MPTLNIGGRRVRVDDSFLSLSPDEQSATVEEIASSLGPAASPAPEGTMGRGTRAQREDMAPETPELRQEIDVAKRMARDRPSYGADDRFLSGATFGLRDEARSAGAGLASLMQGQGFGTGYNTSMEAEKRLAAEYAAQHPVANVAAQVAGGLATSIPQAAAGPVAAATAPFRDRLAALAGNMWQSGKANALVGGVTGAAEGEGTGRLTSGATGAGLGFVLGAGAPAVAAGAEALARPLINTVRAAINPEQEAARRIATALERDQGTSGLPGLSTLRNAEYAAARRDGQPVLLPDAGGENTRALLRSAANTSPEARGAIEQATQSRHLTQAERLDATLGRQSAIRGTPTDLMESAEQAARAANQPAYKAAYEAGDTNIWNPTLERLTQAPAMQTALKNAIKKSANNDVVEGFAGMNPRVKLDQFDNLSFTGEGGVPAYPNLRLWDLTKRELDRMGNMAERAGDADHRIYKGLSNQLKATLDHIPEVGPAYANARATAAKFFGESDAFSAGQAFAARGKDLNPDQAQKALAKMSSEEQKLFREGYIARERERIAGLRDKQDVTVSTMASPDARRRAEVALGKEGAQKLSAQVEVEEAMMATRRALGNSTTARQLAEMGLAGAGGSSLAGVSTGDWSMSNLTMGAAMGGFAKAGKGKIDERLARRVGEMMMSKDPRTVQRLASLASRYPVYLDAVRAIRTGLSGQAAVAVTPNGS